MTLLKKSWDTKKYKNYKQSEFPKKIETEYILLIVCMFKAKQMSKNQAKLISNCVSRQQGTVLADNKANVKKLKH